jgi:hypothetical protein
VSGEGRPDAASASEFRSTVNGSSGERLRCRQHNSYRERLRSAVNGENQATEEGVRWRCGWGARSGLGTDGDWLYGARSIFVEVWEGVTDAGRASLAINGAVAVLLQRNGRLNEDVSGERRGETPKR